MSSVVLLTDPATGVEVRWDKGEAAPYAVNREGDPARRYSTQTDAVRAFKRKVRRVRPRSRFQIWTEMRQAESDLAEGPSDSAALARYGFTKAERDSILAAIAAKGESRHRCFIIRRG